MWFRKEDRPGQEAATQVGGFREGPVAVASDPQSASGFSVESAPAELHARNPQPAKFKPNWRDLARNLVTGPGAPPEACSAYNVLRTRMMDVLQKKGWSTIAVTSPTRRSGNTLTAINLAMSFARDFSHAVLLVELDLIRPSFERILGFGRRRGISDYLLDDAALSEITLDIGVDRLLVIPAGSPVANSAQWLSSPGMSRFVEQIKRSHARQIVLFDLPSVLAVDDAMAFAPLADCALLVVQEEETSVDEVHRALDRLERTHVLGSVLNRSTARTMGATRSE